MTYRRRTGTALEFIKKAFPSESAITFGGIPNIDQPENLAGACGLAFGKLERITARQQALTFQSGQFPKSPFNSPDPIHGDFR